MLGGLRPKWKERCNDNAKWSEAMKSRPLDPSIVITTLYALAIFAAVAFIIFGTK